MIPLNEISVWIIFQLSAFFVIGLPFTLLIWSIKNKNKVAKKLISIFFKVSALFFISLILFIGKQNHALLIMNISTLLMSISLWFWSDINSELSEYELKNTLITITKTWRWGVSFIFFILFYQSTFNTYCLTNINAESCSPWLNPSQTLYSFLQTLFKFLFGANFSEPIAKFLGLFTLLIYTLGLIQWLVIQLPRTGRNSNFSNYGDY